MLKIKASYSGVSIISIIFIRTSGSKSLLYKILVLLLITCLIGLYKVPAKPQRFYQYIYDGCFPFFAHATMGPRSELLCRSKQWQNMNPCP